MFSTLSVLVLAVSVRAPIAVSDMAASFVQAQVTPRQAITPRCDWVNDLRANGDQLQIIIENFYGVVQTYTPLFFVAFVIMLIPVIGFAVRRRLIPGLISLGIAIFFLGSIVAAAEGWGTSSC